MNVNGGNRQLPGLLQPPKLPPINELLKTSVGLLRPVNLASTVHTGNVVNHSNQIQSTHPHQMQQTTLSSAQLPQQMFRFPYGMPLHRPIIVSSVVPMSCSSVSRTVYTVTSVQPYRASTVVVPSQMMMQQPVQRPIQSLSSVPPPQVNSAVSLNNAMPRSVPQPAAVVVVQEKKVEPYMNLNAALKTSSAPAPQRQPMQNPAISALLKKPEMAPTVTESKFDQNISVKSESTTADPMLAQHHETSFDAIASILEQYADCTQDEPIVEKVKPPKQKKVKNLFSSDKSGSLNSLMSPSSGVRKKRPKKNTSQTSPSLLAKKDEGNNNNNNNNVGGVIDEVTKAECEKLKKELVLSRRAEDMLKNELKSVRDKLLNETRLRDSERSKNETITQGLKHEVAQLKKRLQTAESQVSSLTKKNTSLSFELISLKAINGITDDFEFPEDSPHPVVATVTNEQSKLLAESLEKFISEADAIEGRQTSNSRNNFSKSVLTAVSLAKNVLSRIGGGASQSENTSAEGQEFKKFDGLQVPLSIYENPKKQTGRVLRSNIKRTLATVDDTKGREESAGSSQMDISVSSQSLGSDAENDGSDAVGCEKKLNLECPHNDGYSTSVLRNLLRHLARKHNDRPENVLTNKGVAMMACSSCQFCIGDFLGLAVHHVANHFSQLPATRSDGRLPCQFAECQYSAVHQWDLLIHVANCHLKPTNVSSPRNVGAENVKEPALSRPTSSASSHGHLLCICHHCPYRTDRISDMKKHTARRHNDRNGTAFDRREATEADFDGNDAATFVCDFCPARYFRPGDLKKHRARCKSSDALKPEMKPEDFLSDRMLINNSDSLASLKFISPKFNLAARVHAKVSRKFRLMKRRKIESIEMPQKFACSLDTSVSVIEQSSYFPSHCEMGVTDLFHEAPTSPDLALLISNSDIKMLCDFPSDVERLLDE